MLRALTLLSALFLISCASNPKPGTTASAEKAMETQTPAASKTPDKKEKTAPATKAAQNQANMGTVTETNASEVICTYGEVKRELKVTRTSDRCAVEYTKDGATQEIATGTANSPFCTEVMDRVKNNLVSAGYQCK